MITWRTRSAQLTDLSWMADLESRSYPAAEAASHQRLQQRLTMAPECTLVGLLEQPVCFISATRSNETSLSETSMQSHEPNGPSLCIHSVVTDSNKQGQGLASRLIQAYCEHAPTLDGVECMLLICKEHLVAWYQKMGFDLVGPSSVIHGSDPWFECRLQVNKSR